MAIEQYTILNLDTAEDVVSMTGMKLEEVLEIYRETINFDQYAVYWQIGDKWFSMRLAGQFVNSGFINPEVLDMMDYHSQMKVET